MLQVCSSTSLVNPNSFVSARSAVAQKNNINAMLLQMPIWFNGTGCMDLNRYDILIL